MSCAKCGGLVAVVTFGDFYEEHDAVKCLMCGWVGWLEPVPYAPPDLTEWQAEHVVQNPVS